MNRDFFEKTAPDCLRFQERNESQDFTVDENWFNHLEEYHAVIVMREGETKEMATQRCAAKGIVEDRSYCQCKDCAAKRNQEKTGSGQEEGDWK